MSTPQIGKYLPDEEITPQTVNKIKEQIHAELQTKASEPVKDEQPLTQGDINSITSNLRNEGINAKFVSSKKTPSGAYQTEEAFQTISPKQVPKSVQEAKSLLTNFHKKMAEYPKYLSYEGSMVLCVLLAMKQVASVNINNIPMIDQKLIREIIVSKSGMEPAEFIGTFDVKFDAHKDFILIFNPQNHSDIILNMFNTVAHPRPEDLKESDDIRIENDGEKIAVGGGRILLNKKTSQRLAGIEPTSKYSDQYKSSDEKEYVPSPKAVGRNAYEIRTDVLQMAIGWSQTESGTGVYVKPSDDAVIALAKKFYAFVENKR